jgi:hypothetical protein
MKFTPWLAGAGTIFSGYFVVQFLRGTCSGGCSFLWSVPTCMFGFVIFLAILIASLLTKMQVVRGAAVVGILFSLYFSVKELQVCLTCYPLGLPNCVYGLVMYAIIFWLAKREYSPKTRKRKSSK